MTQPNLFTVQATPEPETPRQRGHRLAKLAAVKAQSFDPEWLERACNHVIIYALQTHSYSGAWLLEDARAFAERFVAPPPDSRAWGHVVRTLQRRGKIEAVGYSGAKSSNGSAKVLWMARRAK